MSLTIRNPEAEELAETLARLTGETKTEAVTETLLYKGEDFGHTDLTRFVPASS